MRCLIARLARGLRNGNFSRRMPPFWIAFIFLFHFLTSSTTAQQAIPLESGSRGPAEKVDILPGESLADPRLSFLQATVLGLVEGITEFLPISSTGHLILVAEWLGLQDETPLADAEGLPRVDGKGRAVTRKDAVDAYAIVIQAGAILAVAILSWPRIYGILCGLMGKDLQGRRLLRNLMVAFLPAAVMGLLLRQSIKQYLFGPGPVLLALGGGALAIFWVERRRSRRDSLSQWEYGPDLPALTLGQSFFIGLLQCVALWPGTSRSMMAIIGGYLVGMDPRRSAEFSFLLGLITLLAAAVYEGYSSREVLVALSWGPILWGMLVAFLSAVLAVRWMVGWLMRHGMAIFAWYRLGLSLAVGLWLLF